MKTRKPIFGALILIALFSLSALAQEKSLPGSNPHSFIGTWIVQTEITDCAGNPTESFSKLLSIHAGGTANEVSNSLPPSQRTTAFGIWERLGRGEFVYALRFFRFNPDGTFANTVQAKWTVLVDDEGDSYTANAAIRIVLPNQTVVNLCGTETGTRMEIPQ